MKIKSLFLVALVLSIAVFVVSQADGDVGFRFSLEPDPNETSVLAGENMVCSLIIDAASIAPSKISGFAFTISYPDSLIVPLDPETGDEVTADCEPFEHNGDFINTSGLLVVANRRVIVDGTADGLPIDKLMYSCMTTKEDGCGEPLDGQVLGIITFKAIVDLPTHGYIRWCGLGAPDPDSKEKTSYAVWNDTNYTPNPALDISLPVELSAFSAVWFSEGINLFWKVESQCENLGWNIYRSEKQNGKFEKINAQIVEGEGMTAIVKDYRFVDKDVERGRAYFYYLESISFNGETSESQMIEVRLINSYSSWGAIKSLASH